MSYRPEEIKIVGAGLVGSLLSVMLGQRGYRVDIFERRPDRRLEAVEAGRSINLALSERGIHALRQAGLMELVEPLLIPMKGRMLHLANGEKEFVPYGHRPHEVIYSVSRGALNSLMMTAAETRPDVNVFFKRRCESVNFADNRMMLLDEAAGTRGEVGFDMLIGTDGAGSSVRKALIPVARGESRLDLLDHNYKELEIPAGPNGAHQIEKGALHIWPRGGFMLIALPNLDGSFTVTLFLPKEGDPSFASLDSRELLETFFEEYFPSALALIPDLAGDFFSNPTGSLGTVRCSPWFYENDSLILGDAAHAIVPFHGQGMILGFEDCSELVRLLNEFDDDWERALPELNRIRKPCADAIADMALENYVTMRDSVLDAKFQLKKELGFELERRHPRRFIPRYSMVMFHRIPFDVVLDRGRVQEEILDRLIEGEVTVEGVDFGLGERLIEERLSELLADG